ncbi:MAG: thiamine phosphate synthase [Pseudomonadota bacterium]|jgi:thiamine-phosphate pyrophosphorylase|nr:thiamine phosphate synthase [Pseudomonadota bacterium]
MSTHPLSGLYGITDATLLPDTPTLLRACEAAIGGGMKLLQYRDKSNPAARRLEQATALRALCHRHGCIFLINDDLELARACHADGVHLGQKDGSLTLARKRLGEAAIIGRTCHDRLELALQAEAEGADYVAFGAFFPSRTKPGARRAPLALLRAARARLRLPTVAIGGLSVDNAAEVIAAGADMIAVVHALFAAPDIRARAAQFSRLFPTHSRDH